MEMEPLPWKGSPCNGNAALEIEMEPLKWKWSR